MEQPRLQVYPVLAMPAFVSVRKTLFSGVVRPTECRNARPWPGVTRPQARTITTVRDGTLSAPIDRQARNFAKRRISPICFWGGRYHRETERYNFERWAGPPLVWGGRARCVPAAVGNSSSWSSMASTLHMHVVLERPRKCAFFGAASPSGVIHHFPIRGPQYTSIELRQRCREGGVPPLMGVGRRRLRQKTRMAGEASFFGHPRNASLPLSDRAGVAFKTQGPRALIAPSSSSSKSCF